MARALTAHNAVINTASVSVKTLTIEGKQVTLAVFRQLIEEPIYDWDGRAALRGVGWGHVRYLIDEPPGIAIHLVWQRGEDLRRCIVYRRVTECPQIYEDYFSGNPQKLQCRVGLAQQQSLVRKPFISATRGEKGSHIYHRRGVDTPWGRGWGPSAIPQVIEVARGGDALPEIERHCAEARNHWPPFFDYFEKAWDTYERLVTPLFDLPQLFIAV